MQRKSDHINLTLGSQRKLAEQANHGLFYEPLLSGHPQSSTAKEYSFLSHQLKAPFWISSMTGGVAQGKKINHNLAQACAEFGLGMGLGSCRCLLEETDRWDDFNLRPLIGDAPFFANLGIAQLEHLLDKGQSQKILQLIHKLEADGIIIHINPLQEWFQPEGDRLLYPPIETLKRFRDLFQGKLIVKEVGQGMGPVSLKSLIDLEVDAIEFAAFGGTNFTALEQQRSAKNYSFYTEFQKVGHSAEEMVNWANEYSTKSNCEFILSGGIQGVVHGHALRLLIKNNSLIGMASAFLHHAMGPYEKLQEFCTKLIDSYSLCRSLMQKKDD